MLKSLDDAGRNCWATNIKSLLFTYGYGYIWIAQDVGNIDVFICNFKRRITDCFVQNWHNDISNSSRCHHYKYYKTLLNTERYLHLEIPFKYKIAFAKFRCSNHKLNIELGRHSNTPQNERLCIFCLNHNNVAVIDCEYHAFFQCPKFNIIRRQYLFN